MTGKFSVDELAQIKEAIYEAERKTSGEIVPVIVGQSDFYPAAHFRLSLLFAFIGIFAYYQFFMAIEPLYFLYLFIVGAIIGFVLGYIPFLKMLFTTKEEIEEETRQRALESFLCNGVVDTKERNGVQLFISLMEHKAMITVDSGLQGKLGNHAQAKWDEVLSTLLGELKSGEHARGISKSVKMMGEILEKHYPDDSSGSNELADRLIIDI